MPNAFQYSMGDNGVARLIFDLPNEKVNKLSLPVVEELEGIIDQIKDNKDIKALVLTSGKEDVFIAGADLHSFDAVFKDPSFAETIIQTGHRVFNKLSNLPFPTVAYIHGACLGGGLELALSCTYRMVTDSAKTQLGLPEVSLGIIPGWGGTQRLPRLVGLAEATGLIVGAKPVKAQKAWKIHLADVLVPHEFKEEKIGEFVSLILTPRGKKDVLSKRKLRGMKHWLLEANPIGRNLLFYKAKKEVLQKTRGHYPAPLLAIKLLKETAGLSLQEGLKREAQTILTHLSEAAPISKNLIALFFTQEALKKDPGVSGEVKQKKIASTGVIGAGVMGSGIAWQLTNNDYHVRMKDVDAAAIGKGYGVIKGLYDEGVKKKRIKPSEAALKFQKLTTATEMVGFQHVDLVIEAATENLDLKLKIYQELESQIPREAIIASNTSSINITEMAKSLKYPDRFIGMHFFNPVPRMPLIEIIRGEKTSDQTVATIVDFCKKIGKTPMVVGNCAGFLVNRIFSIGANEVFRLFEEQVPHEQLDRMMLNFGFPMPPFVLADEVGVDVMHKVNKILEGAYGERMKDPKILAEMCEKQLLGKKVGKGFYIYEGKKKKFNPEVLQMIKDGEKREKPLSEIEMNDRVLLNMINEGARCLEEKIIGRPDYLDMALIMGVGFPPFRGGLLRYADSLGINYVVDHLEKFSDSVGSRFAPCDLLLDMRRSNRKFY